MSTEDKYGIPQSDINAMAAEQALQFKRERYNHVMNVMRFEKQKEATDDPQVIEALDAALAQSAKDIATIEAAIDVTLEQIVPEETPS